MKRVLIAVLTILALAAPAAAQEPDERGLLEAFLEDSLSEAGREVRITGFEGALSARATIEELTIADEEGVWLTMRGAVLDWSRAALLRGRLEVSELSAREVLLPRRPAGPDGPRLPSPQATTFRLPELPVSIEIGRISVENLEIGAPVFGAEASVQLSGALSLEAGVGAAALLVERSDGARGRLELDGAFSNLSDVLKLRLSLEEGADGIAANLLRLPGRPPLALAVSGEGPLSDFAADITLASDGAERLGGRLRLFDATPAEGDEAASRRIEAAVGGDIAPLFAPDYRPFFGDDIRLAFSAVREPGGRLEVEALSLRAASVSVTGDLALGAGGLPERFDLAGTIAGEGAVTLPLTGPATSVRRADFAARFDATEGEVWALDFRAEALRRGGLAMADMTLGATGTISDGAARRVQAALSARARGLRHDDPAIAAALGEALSVEASLGWQDGAPLEVAALRVSGAGLALSAAGRVEGLARGFPVSGRLRLNSDDISRFSGLAGRAFAGAAELEISGDAALLGGAFDLELAAQTTGLSAGVAMLDPLLAGRTRLELAARRDTEGTELERLSLENDRIRLAAAGRVADGDGGLKFDASLADLAVLAPDFPGPLHVSGTATAEGEDWRVALDATGPGGTTGRLGGLVTGDGATVDIAASGSAPLGLLNGVIAPRSVAGRADYDLQIAGRPGLGAVSGTVSTENARLFAPALGAAVERVNGRATIAGGVATLSLHGAVAQGGLISVTGPVGLSAPNNAELRVALRGAVLSDPELYRTDVNGDLLIAGPLAAGARLTGTVDLGATEVQIPASTATARGAIPAGLAHVNESAAARETRRKAGLTGGGGAGGAGGGGLGLDLTIRAPNRIFVRGRGLDAELGGQLRLTGSSADIVPIGRFELIRGRLDILGERLRLSEGLIRLEGAFDPYLRLVAEAQKEETLVQVILEGQLSEPEVSFRSEPELPEDEVVARLMFGQGIDSISPFQAARLASAVAALSGAGEGGIVSNLRRDFGLDDLDVRTDETGTAALRVGKYLSENVYTDVTVEAEGKSEINLNLDLSPQLTVKGTLGSTGDSSLGIFYERDY